MFQTFENLLQSLILQGFGRVILVGVIFLGVTLICALVGYLLILRKGG